MARPRKPAAVLEASGSFKKNPQRARERGNEPEFARGTGDCPEHLTGLARDAWHRLAAHLDESGLMRQAHAESLAGAANALALAISADAILRRDGLLVRSGDTAKLHPAYSASLRSWEAFRKFAAEFGLSPKAAAQLAAPEGSKMPTLTEILDRPGELPDLSQILGKEN